MKVAWIPYANRFEIDENTLKHLRSVYPFFDKELLKMEMWYLANPKKHKKNVFRFMVNWLNKVKVSEGPVKPQAVKRDFKKEDIEWRRNMEQAIKEAAPPSDEFRELMNKLKPKGL